MTQTDKILQHLRLHKSITPLEALRDYGCMRLAARIADIKRRGIAVNAELETGISAHGDRVRYTRYTLED